MDKFFKKFFFGVVIIAFLFGGIYWRQHYKITFSVIVPVYNAEKYLERCLDSIFAQKGDFEVIVVNDGSQDKSLQILEKYAKKYSNMHLISQKNQGVSAARNAGIAFAKNKYITFVDSDDWLEPNAFEDVLETIKKDKSDVILTGFYDVYDRQWVKAVRGEKDAATVAEESKFADKKLNRLALYTPFYSQEAHSDLFYAGGGIRGRFYLKEFLDKYQIRFATEIHNHEDDVFMFRVYLHNPFVSVLNVPVYDYRNRVDSISKSISVLSNMSKSFAVMEKTQEYQQAPRRVQLLIKDSWLSLIFLGIANLQRHGASADVGYTEAAIALRRFDMYNKEELKSCRNYWKVYEMLEHINFNQAL